MRFWTYPKREQADFFALTVIHIKFNSNSQTPISDWRAWIDVTQLTGRPHTCTKKCDEKEAKEEGAGGEGEEETRLPVEIWPWVSGDLVSLWTVHSDWTDWSRQKISQTFLRFYWTTTYDDKIFKTLFGKFTSPNRSTLLCAKFVKIVRREIGESVRCLPDQKIRLPLKLSLLRRSRPKTVMFCFQHLSHNFTNWIRIGSLSAELYPTECRPFFGTSG